MPGQPTSDSVSCCSVDPFSRKDWYDVKAPSVFNTRNVGKTLVTRTQGTKVSVRPQMWQWQAVSGRWCSRRQIAASRGHPAKEARQGFWAGRPQSCCVGCCSASELCGGRLACSTHSSLLLDVAGPAAAAQNLHACTWMRTDKAAVPCCAAGLLLLCLCDANPADGDRLASIWTQRQL